MGCVWGATLSTATHRKIAFGYPGKSLCISDLLYGCRLAFCYGAAPQQGGSKAMTHSDSGMNQNQIQKSLVPMLRTWTHSIGWTVLLSAALAVLFAMLCDGCSRIH